MKNLSTLLSNLFHFPKGSAEKPKVLFISHDDFRAGASLLLLQFLKWLKVNSDISFEILLKVVYGDLVDDFQALAPVMIWSEKPDHDPTTTHRQAVVEHLRQANIGLVYSNTFTNGKVVEALSELHCPTICHVHELEFWITHRTEPGNNKKVIQHTQHYIAVSQAVKENLISNLKIPHNTISLVYEFVSTQHDHLNPSRRHHQIRRQLHIPDSALIVGACGTTDWRKGVDLFIPMARSVRQQSGKSVHFVWVGGDHQGPNFAALWHDIKNAGLAECVHFIGPKPNPLDYFSTFDVFALVSREDPFPLVVLEAASLGKPTVCFDRSGGAQEFVEDDCGFVVPYLDLQAMSSKIGKLLDSYELRHRLGQKALEKVRLRHDLRVAAPQLLRVVENFLTKPSVSNAERR